MALAKSHILVGQVHYVLNANLSYNWRISGSDETVCEMFQGYPSLLRTCHDLFTGCGGRRHLYLWIPMISILCQVVHLEHQKLYSVDPEEDISKEA